MSDVTDLIARNEASRKACLVAARSAWVNIMVALDGAGQSERDLLAIDADKATAQLETIRAKRDEMRRLLEERQALFVQLG